MAVALKNKQFNSANDLCTFVANAASNVTTIVAITYDAASGKHVVFFT